MANTKNFIAKNGFSTGDGYSMPDIRPSLLLDFANSKTLDPRITFTRGSTATYWDGKTTTKAEENLIPYSDFSSGWTDEGSTTITLNNDTAPDSTTTAARLFGVNGEVKEYFYDSLPISNSGKLTGSVYLKEAGQRYAYIQLIAGTTSVRQSVLFDLNTGTQVDTATQGSPTGVSYSITSVGNNWYRCVVTMDQSSSSNGYLLIGMAQSASPSWTSAAVATVTGTTSDSIIIWGAQLEERDSVTAYTATSGSPIVKYQPTLQTAASGEARFDHDPVTGESKGLLIEESRTNLVPYSDFTNSSGYNNIFKVGSSIAPDGTQTATILRASADNQYCYTFVSGLTLSQNTTYTYSVFVKAANSFAPNYIWLLGNTSTDTFNFIDPSTGTLGTSASGVTTRVEDVGNGWYRCAITFTNTQATGAQQVGVGFAQTNGSPQSSADETQIEVWGEQIEVGAFPTSYIPTSGSTVTRSADGADITGTSFTAWFGHEATSYVELSSPAWEVDDFDMAYISDGTTNNRIRHNVVLADPRAQIRSNATNYFAYSPAVFNVVTNNSLYRAALAYSSTEAAFSYNGVTPITGSSVFVSPELNQMNLTKNAGVAHFRKFAFYPQRLSNATLQQMTEE